MAFGQVAVAEGEIAGGQLALGAEGLVP